MVNKLQLWVFVAAFLLNRVHLFTKVSFQSNIEKKQLLFIKSIETYFLAFINSNSKQTGRELNCCRRTVVYMSTWSTCLNQWFKHTTFYERSRCVECVPDDMMHKCCAALSKDEAVSKIPLKRMWNSFKKKLKIKKTTVCKYING